MGGDAEGTVAVSASVSAWLMTPSPSFYQETIFLSLRVTVTSIRAHGTGNMAKDVSTCVCFVLDRCLPSTAFFSHLTLFQNDHINCGPVGVLGTFPAKRHSKGEEAGTAGGAAA